MTGRRCTPEERTKWAAAEVKVVTALNALRHHAPYTEDEGYRGKVDVAIRALGDVTEYVPACMWGEKDEGDT